MTIFEEDNLTETDVDHLVHALKYQSRLLAFDQLRSKIEYSIMLMGTEIDRDTVIIGDVDDIEYILHVFCGDPLIIRPKYTINLRFKKSNIQLIRVDIGGRHRNPNEKSARNYPHIHIYNPNYSKKERIAYPLDSKKFSNIDNILRTFDDVLCYTNIQKKPNEYWRSEDNDI